MAGPRRRSRQLRASLVLASVAAVAAACGASGSPTPASPSGAAGSSASASPGAACTPAVPPATRWWNDATFYEVFVRSFQDSDGDGIGDLRGLTSRLDYLNDGDPATTTDLGVTGLWLMPIAEAASYHGYDVTDYRAVERDYGTAEDFRAFLSEAHRRGIRVILDLVLNHTSSQHPWFLEAQTRGSAHDDWYVWSDDRPAEPGWHQAGDRWYFGSFWEGMPELDLRNPEVTDELVDVARFWLDLGVDGFRLDAAKHLIEEPGRPTNTPATKDWLRDFHRAVVAENPDALLVGEVFDPSTIAGPYVPEAVDLTFDFSLAGGIRDALLRGRVGTLSTALADLRVAYPPGQSATFLTNHDQDRILSQLRGDEAAMRAAAFLLFASPGVPFVYYGEEIGMTGRKPDERIRTPMQWDGSATAGFTTGTPWEPLAEERAGRDVRTQAGDPAGLLSTYRALIAFRAGETALRSGTMVPVRSDSEAVAAWLRATPDRTLLAIANTSDAPVDAYALSLRTGPLCGPVTAATVMGSGAEGLGPPAAPEPLPDGGLSGYEPFPVLSARGWALVALDRMP